MNCVRTAFVVGRVGPLYYHMPTVHPGMNVALHWDRNFFGLPTLNNGRRTRWLRTVPRNVAGHRIRLRMNVMRGLIAGDHFELLASIHGHYVRSIHAPFLIKYRSRGWLLRSVGGAETLRDIENNILEALVLANHYRFHFGLVIRVRFRAIGIFRHINASHMRRGAA